MTIEQHEFGELIARGYDRVADEYAALESEDRPWPRVGRLRRFIAPLPDGARVLDLGCGNGLPATRLLAERFRVTGVDISPEQAARAALNVPAASILCGDVRERDFPQGSCDAIVALYLIDNVPSGDYPALFEKLARWLVPGGSVLLSAEPGDDPGRVYDWLDVPMFINTIPPVEIVAMLEDASLEVVQIETEPQVEGGREISYTWFVAVRR